MRRKDGQGKIKSPRNHPKFDGGFRELNPLPKSHHPTQNIVSFFTGCGGLELGMLGGFSFLNRRFRRLPFKTVAAFDVLSDAVETYRLNIGDEIEKSDLSTVDISQLPSSDIVTGGFPCQDFSSSGPKVGLNGKRGQLYTVIRDYIKTHKPKVFIAENVLYLMRLNGGKYLSQIISEFSACGYRVAVWNINCPDFGLPQSRKRIFIIGIRNDLSGFPQKPIGEFATNNIPIDYALADLVNINDETVPNQSQYFRSSRATSGGGQGDH
ncbi:DNA cytosine methyltransferase, partial [Paracoccaceae bacterium]|nr:DNA cytosine methyltransferase [Paracoccaceae bacterium]